MVEQTRGANITDGSVAKKPPKSKTFPSKSISRVQKVRETGNFQTRRSPHTSGRWSEDKIRRISPYGCYWLVQKWAENHVQMWRNADQRKICVDCGTLQI